MFAVNVNDPTIELTFNIKDNVTVNTLTVSATDVDNVLFDFTCEEFSSNSLTSTFICMPYNNLAENLYLLNITAYKDGEDPYVTRGIWNDKFLSIDLTMPEFDLIYPMNVQSSNEVGLIAENFVDELHVMFNISDGATFYEIIDPVYDPITEVYSPFLNISKFPQWVSGNNYTYYVTAFDHALNKFSRTAVVTVDDDPPEINIYEVNATPLYPPINLSVPVEQWNISTTDVEIVIKGNTSTDIDDVCMRFNFSGGNYNHATTWDCQQRCSEGYLEPCINDGNFVFTFDLDFIPGFMQDLVIFNLIEFKAKDLARNENQTSLSILLDWKPPELENVQIN